MKDPDSKVVLTCCYRNGIPGSYGSLTTFPSDSRDPSGALNHHQITITHGESAPADPDLAAPVKFSEAFVGRAQLFGIGGV